MPEAQHDLSQDMLGFVIQGLIVQQVHHHRHAGVLAHRCHRHRHIRPVSAVAVVQSQCGVGGVKHVGVDYLSTGRCLSRPIPTLQILQILSLTLFETNPINRRLTSLDPDKNADFEPQQRSLFWKALGYYGSRVSISC